MARKKPVMSIAMEFPEGDRDQESIYIESTIPIDHTLSDLSHVYANFLRALTFIVSDEMEAVLKSPNAYIDKENSEDAGTFYSIGESDEF